MGLFLLALAVGFVWLPSAQRGAEGSTSGVPFAAPSACQMATRRYLRRWQASLRRRLPGPPRRDETWRMATPVRELESRSTCNGCHGTNGISSDAIIPNLAGQSAAAIYKQLADFRTGKRDAAVMGVYVSPLSEQGLLDLAAYYASLPNPAGVDLSPQNSSDTVVRRLIEVGDPIRGIAPCASCHGPLGMTQGAPGLRGQQRAYLELQMQSFTDGNRRNDISEQMRSVARQLTGEEIALLAAYYSSVGNGTRK